MPYPIPNRTTVAESRIVSPLFTAVEKEDQKAEEQPAA